MATKSGTKDPAAVPAKSTASCPTPDGAGKFVLIVDDESEARDILCKILTPLGFEVATVDCGKECIKILQRRPVDLVLLDLRMPEMEGMDVLKVVMESWPRTRVVIISAYGDWPTYFDALKLGAVDLLQKPYSREELLRVIDVALRKK